jgi:tRNA pseudouridine55 synthase
MLHPTAVATTLFPTRPLTAQEAIDLANGKRIPAADAPGATPVAAVAPNGALVGLVERRGDTLKALVNFPSDEVSVS